jgi:hypothetical protein
METTIVILKTDLQRSPNIGQELSQLSDRVVETEDACQYFPLEGKLVDFMKILMKYILSYELQYEE